MVLLRGAEQQAQRGDFQPADNELPRSNCSLMSRPQMLARCQHLQGRQAEAEGDHDAQEEDHDDAVPRDRAAPAVVAAVMTPRRRHEDAGSTCAAICAAGAGHYDCQARDQPAAQDS